MKLHRFLALAVVVISTGLAPAFAQDGPKGGGGGGGGNAGGGGSGVSGVSGGGNSPGAPSGGGGGGGGGSSFGGGGGSSRSSWSGGGSSADWSSFRGGNRSGGGRDSNRAGSRAAEPSYARAVSPAGGGGDSVRSPGGGHSRGDRPSLGQAIDRQTPIDRTHGGGGVITRYDPFSFGYGYYGYGYGSCASYSLYSRCFDPWYSGYGYYGLGSMLYDPSWFYGPGAMQAPPVNVSEGLGALRLKIKPNQGQVFIDGYYVGTVDEFDGPSQKIKLEQGHHRVEVRLLGYEPLMFDIEIRRGQTSTFEGQLRPRQ